MKQLLLAATALVGVGLMAGPAVAADAIKLEFGGSLKEAYRVTLYDGGAGAPGDERSIDGLFSDTDAHPLGVNIDLGNFALGGLFEYSQNGDAGPADLDRWVAGVGAGYTIDAWHLGLQYSHLNQNATSFATTEQFQQDRVAVTGNYALSPGINLGGELGYSWIDNNPQDGTAKGSKADDYDALEIGIGTNFQF